MEERISVIDDIIEEIDSSFKEKVKFEKLLKQNPVNLGHHEKTKPKNNRYRGMRKYI